MPILLTRAFFFPLSRPLQTLACLRLSVSADEGKKRASSKNAGHTCYPAPHPLKVERSVYILLLDLRAQKSGKKTTMH